MDTLAVLAAAEPGGLSASDLVDAVIAAERLLAHVNGLQVRLLAELGRPNRCADVSSLVAALVDKAGVGRGAGGVVDPVEVAAVTARIRISQAIRMVDVLPATAAALERGWVDVGRARMIVDRTAVLPAGLCGPVERRILPLVAGRSNARLESLVDREVIAADPRAAELRRLAAVKGRSVSHRVDKDGMGVITALLPAESAVVVFTLVDLIAAANKGLDGRDVDQRRADALADIADELLTHGFVDLDGLVARAEHTTPTHPGPAEASDADAPDRDAPDSEGPDAPADTAAAAAAAAVDVDVAGVAVSDVGRDAAAGSGRAGRWSRVLTRHGRRPHLNVTGAWTTLAGLDDLPGQLDGHGTITADLLRAIAASWGSVTAVGVDPATGTATAVGALTYRPGRRVSDQVILVSGTCRAAGCRMPADKCDLDHLEPFNHQNPSAGGRTTPVNQWPFCRFHHLLKHHTDWTPHLRSDMTVVWTTATGHTAVSHPREFTAPGEWDRAGVAEAGMGGWAAPRSELAGDPGDVPVIPTSEPPGGAMPAAAIPAADNQAPGGAVPAAGSEPPTGAGTPPPTGAGGQLGSAALEHVTPNQQLRIGPVVAGPTIPVVPAGTDHQEPHTELEDPATVPHPGSVEITSYRILRADIRQHALRRIRRLATDRDAATNRDRDRDPAHHPEGDRNPGHEAEPSGQVGQAGPSGPAVADPDELDRNYRAALHRTRTRAGSATNHQESPLMNLLDQSGRDPIPDEPPF